MEKIDARKLSTDAQQEIRYQVIRLKQKGLKRSEISNITGIYPSTISVWWRLYKNGGKKALKIKKGAARQEVTARYYRTRKSRSKRPYTINAPIK